MDDMLYGSGSGGGENIQSGELLQTQVLLIWVCIDRAFCENRIKSTFIWQLKMHIASLHCFPGYVE